MVERFVAKYDLDKAEFDGCAFGCIARNRKPIKKPWTVKTNDIEIHRFLNEVRCPNLDRETWTTWHAKHEPCAGANTAGTARYPDRLVEAIHDAWRTSCDKRDHCGQPVALAASQLNGDAKFYGDDIPTMPVQRWTTEQNHRVKNRIELPIFNAMVARQLGKKEILENIKAQAAMKLEWDGLRKAGVWDMSSVRSWKDVAREARDNGTKVHVGRIFGLCVEKNTQFKLGDALRKFKGRFVFQGNEVRDELYEYAFFDDISSAPAALEAAKACDAYGCIDGNTIMQADAFQAYIQSDLGGDIPTWVRLPPEYVPKAWANIHDPVVLLKKALYGHPRAGNCWEKYFEGHLAHVGFKPIKDDWRSCYYHDRLKLFLTIYVDDFKMSGPKEAMTEGWKLIRDPIPSVEGDHGIETNEPSALDKYLGAVHVGGTGTLPSGNKITTMTYDMSGFMQLCVDAYLDLAGLHGIGSKDLLRIKHADTPFLDIEDAVDEPSDGILQPIACKILMKILYGARTARFDLLRPVAYLARRVTKWSRACDRLLHRLICYIAATKEYQLTGYVGDSANQLELKLYSDADFAGCKVTKRSTTGIFLCLVGPNTFYPLNAISKKQTCVSHSTPEAELVAADAAMRIEGLPSLTLWETLLHRTMKLNFMEDNSAAAQVIRTGKNPNMRHMGRTHQVCTHWLHETLGLPSSPGQVINCPTEEMAADLMTKAFFDGKKWQHAIAMVGIHQKGYVIGSEQKRRPIATPSRGLFRQLPALGAFGPN